MSSFPARFRALDNCMQKRKNPIAQVLPTTEIIMERCYSVETSKGWSCRRNPALTWKQSVFSTEINWCKTSMLQWVYWIQYQIQYSQRHVTHLIRDMYMQRWWFLYVYNASYSPTIPAILHLHPDRQQTKLPNVTNLLNWSHFMVVRCTHLEGPWQIQKSCKLIASCIMTHPREADESNDFSKHKTVKSNVDVWQHEEWDVGGLQPCRYDAHTTAVLSYFHDNYIPIFSEVESITKIHCLLVHLMFLLPADGLSQFETSHSSRICLSHLMTHRIRSRLSALCYPAPDCCARSLNPARRLRSAQQYRIKVVLQMVICAQYTTATTSCSVPRLQECGLK